MQASLFRRNAVLIEQNPIQCRLYEDVLDANGFDVYVAKSVIDALIKAKEQRQDIVILNTEISDEKFILKFIRKLKELDENVPPIIGLSIYPKEKKQNVACVLDNFLTKPFSIDKFIDFVDNCIEGEKIDSQGTCCK